MGIYNTSKYGQSEYGAQAEHPYLNTPGKLMWLVQIDWDRDGVFGPEIEPQTIVELKFKRGRKERILTNGQGQEQPDQETCWLVIYDPDGRYDSFNQASALYNYLGSSGMMMRFIVVSTTDDTSSAVFVGTLASATYDINTGRATLQGEGCARLLQIGEAEHLYNECQPTNQMNSAGWDSYFTFGVGNTPFPINWWSGRDGGLPLRECVRLTLDTAGWSLGMYAGQTNYNDDYPDFFYLTGDSAWRYLRDLADGFAARLFFLRDGRLFVMDRQDATGLPGSNSVFGSPLLSYGLERKSPYETLRNQVEVQVRPHDVPRPFGNSLYGFQYMEVWSNAGPVSVPPSSSQYFDIEYLYNGQVVAGNFLYGNIDLSLEVWSSPDKTGTDLVAAGMAGVSAVFQTNADGYQVIYGNNQSKARIRLINSHATLTAYFFGMKMMMVGVTETGNPATETASDANSIALNNRRILTINSPWVQRSSVAANVAQAYVDALADRQKASPVTLAYFLSGDALYAMLTNYDLGSVINFGEVGGDTSLENYGMNGHWLMVGMELQWVNPDGQDAIVKVTYEKFVSQVELVGTTTKTANTSAAPNWLHTVPSGSNRLLVVEVGLRAFQTVTSVTYGSQALTKAGAVQYAAGNYARAEIWYLAAPTVGAATITVNISGTEVVEAAALNFVNVNQTTPIGSFSSNAGLGGSTALLGGMMGTEGDLVLDVLVKEAGTLTPDASQTSQWAASGDGSWKGGGSTKLIDSNSDSVDMDWSLTGANAWVLAGVTIKSIINS